MAYINGHEIFFGIVGTVGTVRADELNTNGQIVFGKASILRIGLSANEVKYCDGSYLDINVSAADMYLNEARQTDTQRGVKMRLGVGTTPPTPEDIWLDETEVDGVDINTYITCTSASVAGQTDGSVKYSFTFSNRGNSAVTINEICILCSPSRTNPPENAGIMLGRKVITPTTIAAGGTATFTYDV